MNFVANFPKEIVFRLVLPNEDEYFITNNNWFDLPEAHPCQKDVQKFQFETIPAYPFIVRTKKELKNYKKDHRFHIHENKPVEIKLAGYEDEGTKSQTRLEAQVQLPSGHSVSISQDVFINALLKGGLGPGGKLPGKYVFATVNRRVKLVQVDSGLYNAICKQVKNRSRKPLAMEQMDVGKVYKTAAGTTGLFLGFVTTETMKVDLPSDAKRYWSILDLQRINLEPLADFGVRFLPQKLASLWYLININKWSGGQLTQDELLEKLLKDITNEKLNKIQVNKTHRYVEEVKGYHLDFPFDIVTAIRSIAVRKAETLIHKARIRRTNPQFVNYKSKFDESTVKNKPDILRHYDACLIELDAALANMSLFGSGLVRSEPFKMFERWETKHDKFKKAKK